MIVYSGMRSDEFIDQFRMIAERHNNYHIIEQLDRLRCVEDAEAEVVEAEDKLEAMEKDKDDLFDELYALLSVLPAPEFKNTRLVNQIRAACSALERHGHSEDFVNQLRDKLGLKP